MHPIEKEDLGEIPQIDMVKKYAPIMKATRQLNRKINKQIKEFETLHNVKCYFLNKGIKRAELISSMNDVL